MSAFIVHAAEAVLGPWGLLAGVGIGAVVLARKARRSAADEPGSAKGGFAMGWVGRVPGVAALGSAAAHVGEWWSDLYAEARHDWETSRSAGSTQVDEPAPARRRARRPRGANGRFQEAPEE